LNRNTSAFSKIVEILSNFSDLDKLLSRLVYIPKTLTSNTLRAGIEALLSLKHTLQVVREIVQPLQTMVNENNQREIVGEEETDDLISRICQSCNGPALTNIENAISLSFSENVSVTNSTNAWTRHQECFAMKEGINGLLDVARATYLQLTQEIYVVSA
jgi:DNA mismatch repair protein MSH4